ncbi:MAG: type II toxin-antitoxin system VapB family antitoxin [Deltaproteobacteria bacterium]|nr:type II toxin-antitoxin system VapB family antitoxin [Deltaproteobacteria bacterium]
MPLSIKNRHAEELAHAVICKTGESLTQAIIVALEERLERLHGRRSAPDLLEIIHEIQQRYAKLPDIDSRSNDEILGYDQFGTFEGKSW